MRFLVLSEGGDGVGLALRLAAEGNESRIFIRDPESATRGKGIVEHDDNPGWGECIVADCTGMGSLCDRFKEHGAKVVGGSALADRLESDRKYAEEVMKQVGMLVPESKSFTDWSAAEKFIKDSEARLVFKPEGKMSGLIPSYTPKSNEELLESFEHFKSLIGTSDPEFTLQEFIEGTCISTEGWFDGSHFVSPFNHTIERKHLFNDDIGPSGGCTGNLIWTCDSRDPIVRQTVLLMEGFLREHDYRGPLDVNAVVNERGAYALEFTPRMGWDSFPTLLYSLYTGDIGSLLWDCASGGGRDSMDISDRCGAGIRISRPPWPSEGFKSEKGVPVRGIAKAQLITDFYPYEIMEENDKLVTSEGYGIVGVMNASGKTPGEAFARAYQKVKQIEMPDIQYRTDLGKVCYADYRKLEILLTGRDAGWIGVDLDKTLAKGSAKRIGDPVEKMVSRVKRWLRDGKEVRLLTARANDCDEQVKAYDWLEENDLPLYVTSEKDHEMVRLWDDRVEQVEVNTGERVA